MTMFFGFARLNLFYIFFLILNYSLVGAETLKDSRYVEMVQGEEFAPVTLIEYASFTCPHCADFHKNVLPKLQKDYIDSGKVKFIYREVYFDAPGLWAGLLARCAGSENYFGIANLLYKKQDKWSSGSSSEEILNALMSIGRQAGISNEQTLMCMKDEEKALDLVEAFQKNSKDDSITSTPSLVLNGKVFKNIPYEDLKVEIERILN